MKKELKWLQICKPCPKSPTGQHEFYVKVTGIGKLRARYNLWFDKLGGEARSVHRKACKVCGSRKNVRIIRVLEGKIQDVEKADNSFGHS